MKQNQTCQNVGCRSIDVFWIDILLFDGFMKAIIDPLEL